jgi:hypothetical protein
MDCKEQEEIIRNTAHRQLCVHCNLDHADSWQVVVCILQMGVDIDA